MEELEGRMKIIKLLMAGQELSLSQIIKLTKLDRASVENHLNYWKIVELIQENILGRKKTYKYNDPRHEVSLNQNDDSLKLEPLAPKGEIEIINLLRKNQELSLSQIIEMTKLDRVSVENHLNNLKIDEFIQENILGRKKTYKLNEQRRQMVYNVHPDIVELSALGLEWSEIKWVENDFKKFVNNKSSIPLKNLREILKIDDKSKFNRLVFYWAKKYNFRIDGDYLLFETSSMEKAIEKLKVKFETWDKSKNIKDK